jgi:hypothetical protein
MDYQGRYKAFDFTRLRTYPLAGRQSKMSTADLVYPDKVAKGQLAGEEQASLRAVADAVQAAREKDQPVILFTGAHLIKNGFGPLLIDLMAQKKLTLLAMNMAGMIHDLEIAFSGGTSENVPEALPRGEFGFAEETGQLINQALGEGEKRRIGAGEAIGELISGQKLAHGKVSVVGMGYEQGIPVTLHAGIGTDIIDQHPSFDPAAKGGCSGRDFAVFCAELERMKQGGVFINVGSAVTGPEVLLKACSMAANVGSPPQGIITAVLDLQPGSVSDAEDERSPGYYRRDLKTVAVRVPQAFAGQGYYIQGNHRETVPALYREICGE